MTTISTASATVAVVVVVAQPLHGTSVRAVHQEVVTPAGVAAVKGAAATVRAITASMVATATLHRFATTSTVKVFLSGQPFSVSEHIYSTGIGVCFGLTCCCHF
jgi:hypothetical protein